MSTRTRTAHSPSRESLPESISCPPWKADPGLEFRPDQDGLKPFEEKAVKITVEEDGTTHVDLTPIKPEDAQPQ